MEAELEEAGHPNLFQSTPVVTNQVWDLLETFHVHTSLYTQVNKGNAGAWMNAAADIVSDVDTMPDLLHNLATVKRSLAPTTQVTCLLMSAFLRHLMGDGDVSRAEMIEKVQHAAQVFTEFVIEGELQNPAPGGGDWGLDDALGTLETFHVLEALPGRWSPDILFKCNCPEIFKNAACVHSVLAGMLCDPSIQVPRHYLGGTIQQRRKRGRPSKKGSEIGDMAEAKARARIELQSEYKLPKVRVNLWAKCDTIILNCRLHV